MNPNQKLATQIEELGIFFEKFNMPPVPSRVLAYLLIDETKDISFSQIQLFLHASRSSINNAIKWLINDGRIEYYTKAGDRTKYFKISPESWVLVMQERVKAWGTSTKLIKKALDNRENSKFPEFNEGLEHIIKFESFLQEKWDEYFDNWNQNVSFEDYTDEKKGATASRGR